MTIKKESLMPASKQPNRPRRRFNSKPEMIPVKFSRTLLASKRIRLIAGCFVLLALISYPFLQIKKTQAEVISLFSSSCSGGWENTQEAIGTPDILEGSIEKYSDLNSASISNASAPILCSGFKGEIPQDVIPKKIVLRFSWTNQPSSAITIDPSIDQGPPVTDEAVSSESGVEPEQKTEQELESAQEIEPVQETQPAQEVPADASPAEESSLLEKLFITQAHAQETVEPITFDPAFIPAGATLGVRYSFDNETWQELGYVRDIHNGVSFEIPVDVSTTMANLEKIQIVVDSLPTLDITPKIYLDAMWLDLEYQTSSGELSEEEINNLPRIRIDNLFKDTTDDFQTDEEPKFEVDANALDITIPNNINEITAEPTVVPESAPEQNSELESESGQELEPASEVINEPESQLEPAPVEGTLPPTSRLPQKPFYFIKELREFTSAFSGIWFKNSILTALAQDVIEVPAVLPVAETIAPAPVEVPTEVSAEPIEPVPTESSGESIIPNPIDAPIDGVIPTPNEPITPGPIDAPIDGAISSSTDNIISFASSSKLRVIKSEIFDPEGEKTQIQPIIEEINGSVSVSVPTPTDTFVPGKYRMEIEILKGRIVFVSSQDFTWGVLAINVNKSIYVSGEDAYLQMGVLDDIGNTVCDASLKLTIRKDASQNATEFSTASETIQYSKNCGANNVTNDPDYFAYYETGEAGIYQMILKRVDPVSGVTVSEITDSFEVKESVPFEVERIGATRINPFLSKYVMTLKIRANQDFSGEIVESIPSTYIVTESDDIRQQIVDATTFLIWEKNVSAGETFELHYEYQGEKISPQVYVLGPLKFSNSQNWFEKLFGVDEQILFQEARQWQIASDSLSATWTGAVNGNWSNGGNWSGGTAPNAGDNLIFPSGASNLSNTNDLPQNTIFNSITLTGSGYTLGGNDIVLGPGLAGITDSVSSGGNTISLNIRLDTTVIAYRNIFVTNSGETLTISGMIGGAGGFNKEGLGKLVLSGANTYAGVTNVNVGVLNVQHSTGLGTIVGGTTVVGNAALELENNIAIGYEALTLRGFGISNSGALRNISGNNSFAGLITQVAGGAEIASDADTLSLIGGIAGAFPLALDGAGNITFDKAPLAIAAGTVTKNGAGTVLYNFPNTYTGATIINEGTLLYGVDNAILSSAITMAGGTLDIATYSDMVGAVTLGLVGNLTNPTITGSTGVLTSSGFTVYSGTISAIIAGDAVALTKNSPGTVILTRPNLFTGAVALNAGVLKIQDSMSLGLIDGATTVAAGATLQIDGNGLSIPEYITISGTGMLYTGAIRNTTGNNTLTGVITLAAAAMIKADSATILTVDGKGISAATLALTIAGAGNVTTTASAPIWGTTAALVKNDGGTLTLGGYNNFTGSTTINDGTIILSGAGTIPASAVTINSGATLTVDNSTTDLLNRLSSSTFTMNGGNFNYIGHPSVESTEGVGALTLSTGHNIITVTPGAGGPTTLTFASLTRTAGATVLFRGTNLGATPAANVSTIMFTSIGSNLIGAAGAANSATISVIKGGFGDTSLSGTGSDMVTYNVGNSNGVRLLNQVGFSGEYASDFSTANANVKLTANTAASTQSINSLILDGFDVTNPGSGQTVTMSSASLSGNILINSANNIAGANTTIGITTNELQILASANSTISAIIGTAVAGSMTLSGTGNVTLSTAVAYTGLTSVNNATLTYGASNMISTGGVTVNNGTYDIVGFSDTVGAVILQRGTITGVAGVLTASSYSLRSGTVSAILAGSGTLTCIATNVAADAVVTLTRDNTYTGTTAITSGILRLGAAGGGTNTPLGTTAAGTTIANIGALDLNGFTLGTAEAITSMNGLGFGPGSSVANGNSNMGALMNTSSTPVSYSGAITLGAASRINADAGALTISSNISGATLGLTIGGFSDSTFSGVIGTTSGTVTKDGFGTVTLSGNNSYTGATTISVGKLKLGSAGSGSNTPLGTTGAATTVTAGAMLDLNGFSLTTAEALTLNGIGFGHNVNYSPGALTNGSGTAVTHSGLVTLGTTGVAIIANNGDLNLSNAGTISGSGFALTIGGTGNGSITSIIGTVAGTVTKIGSGTWTLSGASTFTGATTVANGTLKLGAAGGVTNTPLGTTGTGTVVNSMGVLDLNGFTLGTAEGLTLNGRGINDGGALVTAATCSYSGAIAAGSDSRIASPTSGQTLSLSGAVSGTNFILRIGGTGNVTLTGATAAAAVALTKDGSGTFTVNASQGHTGNTIIEAGTLQYGASGLLAVTPITVQGGTWNAGGITDTVGVITLIDGTISNGTLTGATNYTVEKGTISAVLAGAFPLIKNRAGTVTMTAANTMSSTATINGGTLTLSGSGALASIATSFTINLGATLTLDNSSTAVASRLPDALALTMNGGNFNFIGNTAALSSETAGALTPASGHNVITVTPGTGGSTTMTFASFARTAGATVLFRGTSFGSTPAANISTLMFTAAPTLTGASGAANSTTISVVKGCFGDTSLTGTGSDMVTYNVGNTNGLRLLNGAGFSGEYAAAFATPSANVKLTANTAAATQSINSLILNGNGVTNPGTAQTVTLAGTNLSGNILINSANDIAGSNTTIGITTFELPILATANSTISAIIGTATTGSVDISGSGNVTLSTAGAYTGTTFINNATLTYGASNVISSGGVTIVGGTYDLNTSSDTIGALSLNAGTVTSSSGTLTLGGTVTTIANNNVSSIISGNLGLGGNRSFNTGDGVVDNDVIVSAVVSGGFNITKDTGAGVLVFSGDNTYTGTTTINAGTLRLGAAGGSTNTPLGTTGGATTVSGASSALDLNGYTLGTSEALTLSGALAAGALQNLSSAAVTYNGLITLGAASTIISNYGDINIANTGTISGATFALTFGGSGNGTLSSILGNTSGGFTKNGVGMWTLSGNSTFTGATALSAGTLRLGTGGSGANTPLGTTAGATTITSGAMLDLNGYTLTANEPITTNGTGMVAYGAITNNSASATTYPGVITLGSTASRFVNFGAGKLTFGHNIVGSTRAWTVVAVGDVEQISTSVWSGTSSSLTKEGSGILTLAGQNSITTGTVTVSTGTLKIGANGGVTNTPLGTNAAGTVVAAGAVLDLSTFTLGGASTWEPLTLNGSGIKNGGALISSSSGTNTFGVLTLGSAARIINSGSGTITFAGAPTGTFNYVVGGTGPTTFSGIFPAVAITITKFDSGILSLNAANLLTGLVRINGGTLKYGATDTLATGNITIAGGTLDINGFSDSVGTVTLISGSIINGGGAATLTSTATYALESGTISAVLGSAVAAGISKTTSGQIILSGNNSYTSTSIALSAGRLNLQNSNALGAAGTSLTTTVSAGATLELQNNITIPSTKLITVNGTGAGGIGAIRNISDSNTIQSAITLTAINPRINSDSGTLTVSGNIGGATFPLIVGGAGNTLISGVIGTTSGTLYKDGAGTLTLTTATNSYTGLTTIYAGVINIQNAASLGTTAAGTVVNSGAALQIQGTITVGAEALTLNGTGVSSTGALRNISDTNTYQGTITLASSSSIGSDSGTLNISGTITGGSGIGLTKVGAGTIAPSNTIALGGDFAISAGTFTASANTITVGGNWSNSGTFTAGTSTVTLNGSSTQTLSGTMTSGSAFNNLTITNASGTSASDCERTGFVPSVDFDASASAATVTFTTANTRVEYNSGSTYTFTNINWNGQASGTKVNFRNSAITGTWLLNVSGTQTVSYVDVSRSNASGGSAIVADDGTNTDCGSNTNWNFPSTLTMTTSISDNSISFGLLSASNDRYATGTSGDDAEQIAHTIDVTSSGATGYTLYVQGDTLTRSGGGTIDAIGATPAASSLGTEQFGIRATVSGGSGAVASPYNHASNYGFNATGTTQSTIGSASGPSTDIFSLRYLCNISAATEAGTYSTTLTYTAVGSF